MRTKVTIEDRILQRAKRRARHLGLTLNEYVNRVLAEDLLQEALPTKPFRMIVHGNRGVPVHREPSDFARPSEDEEATSFEKRR